MMNDERKATVVVTADTDDYQKNIKKSTDETKKLSKGLDEVSKKLDGITKRTGNKLMLFGAGNIAVMSGMAAVAGTLQKQMSSIEASAAVINTSFERMGRYSQMDVGRIREGIRATSTSTPTSRSEVAAITTQLVKSGLNNNNDQIERLSKSFDQASYATGESASGIISGNVQLSRQMGNQRFGLGGQLPKYNDVATYLSNTAGVSATGIFDFAQQLAGPARMAGISQTDLMGISAAFQRSGADGMYAANTFNSIINTIEQMRATGNKEGLRGYASVLGISHNDMEGMTSLDFFRKMIERVGSSGTQGIQMMNMLGFDGIRAQKAIQNVAGQGGVDTWINQARIGESSNASEIGADAATQGFADSMLELKNKFTDLATIMGETLLPSLDMFGKAINSVMGFFKPILDIGAKLSGIGMLGVGAAAVGGGAMLKNWAAMSMPLFAQRAIGSSYLGQFRKGMDMGARVRAGEFTNNQVLEDIQKGRLGPIQRFMFRLGAGVGNYTEMARPSDLKPVRFGVNAALDGLRRGSLWFAKGTRDFYREASLRPDERIMGEGGEKRGRTPGVFRAFGRGFRTGLTDGPGGYLWGRWRDLGGTARTADIMPSSQQQYLMATRGAYLRDQFDKTKSWFTKTLGMSAVRAEELAAKAVEKAPMMTEEQKAKALSKFNRQTEKLMLKTGMSREEAEKSVAAARAEKEVAKEAKRAMKEEDKTTPFGRLRLSIDRLIASIDRLVGAMTGGKYGVGPDGKPVKDPSKPTLPTMYAGQAAGRIGMKSDAAAVFTKNAAIYTDEKRTPQERAAALKTMQAVWAKHSTLPMPNINALPPPDPATRIIPTPAPQPPPPKTGRGSWAERMNSTSIPKKLGETAFGVGKGVSMAARGALAGTAGLVGAAGGSMLGLMGGPAGLALMAGMIGVPLVANMLNTRNELLDTKNSDKPLNETVWSSWNKAIENATGKLYTFGSALDGSTQNASSSADEAYKDKTRYRSAALEKDSYDNVSIEMFANRYKNAKTEDEKRLVAAYTAQYIQSQRATGADADKLASDVYKGFGNDGDLILAQSGSDGSPDSILTGKYDGRTTNWSSKDGVQHSAQDWFVQTEKASDLTDPTYNGGRSISDIFSKDVWLPGSEHSFWNAPLGLFKGNPLTGRGNALNDWFGGSWKAAKEEIKNPESQAAKSFEAGVAEFDRAISEFRDKYGTSDPDDKTTAAYIAQEQQRILYELAKGAKTNPGNYAVIEALVEAWGAGRSGGVGSGMYIGEYQDQLISAINSGDERAINAATWHVVGTGSSGQEVKEYTPEEIQKMVDSAAENKWDSSGRAYIENVKKDRYAVANTPNVVKIAEDIASDKKIKEAMTSKAGDSNAQETAASSLIRSIKKNLGPGASNAEIQAEIDRLEMTGDVNAQAIAAAATERLKYSSQIKATGMNNMGSYMQQYQDYEAWFERHTPGEPGYKKKAREKKQELGQTEMEMYSALKGYERTQERSVEDYNEQTKYMEEDRQKSLSRSRYDFNLQLDRSEEDFNRNRLRAKRDHNRALEREEINYHKQVTRAKADFKRQQERDLEQQTATIMNPYQRQMGQATWDSTSLLVNLNEQNNIIKQHVKNLDKLQELGMSMDTIDALGLSDINNWQQTAELANGTSKAQMRRLNRVIGKRKDLTADLVKDKRWNKIYRWQEEDFERSLRRQRKDRKENLEWQESDWKKSLRRQRDDWNRGIKRLKKDYKTGLDRQEEDWVESQERREHAWNKSMRRMKEDFLGFGDFLGTTMKDIHKYNREKMAELFAPPSTAPEKVKKKWEDWKKRAGIGDDGKMSPDGGSIDGNKIVEGGKKKAGELPPSESTEESGESFAEKRKLQVENARKEAILKHGWKSVEEFKAMYYAGFEDNRIVWRSGMQWGDKGGSHTAIFVGSNPPEWWNPAYSAYPMARGGIVTGPTNALIGEAGSNEAVIPLNSQGISYLVKALTEWTGKSFDDLDLWKGFAKGYGKYMRQDASAGEPTLHYQQWIDKDHDGVDDRYQRGPGRKKGVVGNSGLDVATLFKLLPKVNTKSGDTGGFTSIVNNNNTFRDITVKAQDPNQMARMLQDIARLKALSGQKAR